MLGVPRLWVDEDAVAVSFALEVVLGQGRALVRSIRLLTEQSDLSVETFLAQGLSCNGAGQAAADNDEARFACSLVSLIVGGDQGEELGARGGVAAELAM